MLLVHNLAVDHIVEVLGKHLRHIASASDWNYLLAAVFHLDHHLMRSDNDVVRSNLDSRCDALQDATLLAVLIPASLGIPVILGNAVAHDVVHRALSKLRVGFDDNYISVSLQVLHVDSASDSTRNLGADRTRDFAMQVADSRLATFENLEHCLDAHRISLLVRNAEQVDVAEVLGIKQLRIRQRLDTVFQIEVLQMEALCQLTDCCRLAAFRWAVNKNMSRRRALYYSSIISCSEVLVKLHWVPSWAWSNRE